VAKTVDGIVRRDFPRTYLLEQFSDGSGVQRSSRSQDFARTKE
jgi:hypothetical protein